MSMQTQTLNARRERRRDADPALTIIVPVYDEEAAIEPFMQAVGETLDDAGLCYEVLFIDDGSRDSTRAILDELIARDGRVSYVALSRNFGKEAALSAGIDHARGDVVIPMDVDLQDPPAMIPRFVEKWREGFDVVYGIRASREADSVTKRVSSSWFYRIFNRLSRDHIPPDAGDFRLMDRKVVEALRAMPERNRFMKGLFAWVGFASTGVEFDRPPRTSGHSKWSYWRLWNFALDGFAGFTTLPLRLWLYVGAVVSVLSFIYAVIIISRVLIYGVDVPGYASLLTVVLFFGGVQLLSLGTIGEYLARLFIEVKRRPLYVVDEYVRGGANSNTTQTADD